jgi:type IV secretion system protein VirB9
VSRAARRGASWWPTALSLLCAMTCASALSAAAAPASASDSRSDIRLRSAVYSVDQVYRLRGYAGYQIDLEFEPGESFIGLGAGDVEALAFVAQDNHLFVKPKAVNVHTNLTVLTTRRSYHFDYSADATPPDPGHRDVIYVLRFVYVKVPAPEAEATASPDSALAQAPAARRHNTDYWYCGRAALPPTAAWDDGVNTHLHCGARG